VSIKHVIIIFSALFLFTTGLAAAKARTYAQDFANVFSDNFPSSYIDLGHFAQLIEKESKDKKVQQAARELQAAIKLTVILPKNMPG